METLGFDMAVLLHLSGWPTIRLMCQIRWNPLPLLALRHFARQSRRILPEATGFPRTQCLCALAVDSDFRKTRNQLMG